MREHMSREERDLVRELVDGRVRDLARDMPRRHDQQRRPCIYCGTPTRSMWHVCPDHLELVESDPGYRARYYR